MNTPRVSVVLPTYNHVRFLPHAVASVLAQTFADFELIIVNDGSTDGTREYLETLKDPRVRVLHQPNKRLPGALNAGFQMARGSLLTWTSADNYCAPVFLQALVEALDAHPDAGLAVSAFEWVDQEGRLAGLHRDQDLSLPSFLVANPGIASFLYRKSAQLAVGEYEASLEGAEDWDMWLRLAERFPVVYVPEVLYYYRRHDDSMTGRLPERIVEASKRVVLRALERRGHQLELDTLFPALSRCTDRQKAETEACFELGTRFLQSQFVPPELAAIFLSQAFERAATPAILNNLAFALARAGRWEDLADCLPHLEKLEHPKVAEVATMLRQATLARSTAKLSAFPLFSLKATESELLLRTRGDQRTYSLTLGQNQTAKEGVPHEQLPPPPQDRTTTVDAGRDELGALLTEANKAFAALDLPAARDCYQQALPHAQGGDEFAGLLRQAIATLDAVIARMQPAALPDRPVPSHGFSFCIITNGKRPEKLRREIESIRALQIPHYEILVGGDVPAGLGDVRVVSVPDAARNGRLGEMRNRLTEQARFDHLVVADDDLVFLPDFFAGLCGFGDDYDVLCVRFLNPNGTRYWDWATSGGPRGHALLGYDETDPHVYVTGGLCIMKAGVARRVKWDETLGYYKGEDTEFSGRLRAAGVSIKFNPHSTVIHHDTRFTQFGNVVQTADGLRGAALDHLEHGRQAEAATALALRALLAPESAHTAGPAAEGRLAPAVQSLLDDAAQAFQGGDLRAVHELLQRALQEAPESRSVREAAADATRALRESIPVADLSGHIRPARLTIALLTRDDLEHTQRCLASLRQHTAEPFNVFVVDNGSTDGTREWFTQQSDGNLFVEFSPVDLGAAGGRNRLLQLLRPHLPDDGFVIFLSSGIEVLPAWTEHFDNFLTANPHVGVAAANGQRCALLGDGREFGEVLVETPTPIDMAGLDSGCWVRAAALNAVGNFDEGLGRLWHGDDDFSVRALAAGWDVYIVPSAPLLRFPPKSATAKLAAAQDNSPATQRYLVNRWRALGLLGANGQIQRPAPRRPLEAVPAHKSPARVSIPVRWGGPIFNPSGYASEAISFILPLSHQLNLGILHDNNLTSRKHFEELPVAERDRLLALHEKCSRMRGGIYISHNPAHGFRRTPDAIYHIGRTMYETDRIPPSWVSQCNMMDEVWVPSHFNVETFAKSGVERDKLFVMPGAVDEDLFDPAKHQPLPLANAAKFNFVSVFEWSSRKAWDVLLAAYLREFSAEDDVCLHLRTYLFSQPDADPSVILTPLIRDFASSLNLGRKNLPRIELLSRQIPSQDLPRLYLAADCLVVPTRGEGWGRPMHEAMAMGRPVIATNWSANTEFMNEENSYLIDYELVEVKSTEPQLRHYFGHRWANPSEQHLRRTMRHVLQNPADALAKGTKARAHVTRHYSRAAVAELVMQRLETIERKFSTPACPPIVARPAVAPATRQRTDGGMPVVAWEGTFLDHGSLSHVNRELTAALEKSAGFRLIRINPAETDGPRSGHPVARDIRATAPANTQITVRHSWPPVWEKPKSGKWVHIQPWEFGSLPKDWATAAAHADEIWAYSEYVRGVYVTGGIDPRKVKVVPLGIDPQRFRSDARPRPLATRKRFKFLFVGGTIQRKGPDILLAAYLKSFTAADDVSLVIKDFGGNGVYAGQTLEAQIKSIQTQPDAPEILYLNEDLPSEALPSLYTACDCLVHPYRGEGFGLPVLEAMACGLPVLVTAGGSTDDFATDEFAYRIPAVRRALPKRIAEIELITRGWVLEPSREAVAERMRWVFEHPTVAKAKGQSASTYVRKEWTWERAAAIALQHLRNLLTPTSIAEPAVKGTTIRKPEAAPLPGVAALGSLASAEELWRKKSPRAAWETACAAIKQRPFHPEAWLLLGEIARLAGNGASAIRCAQQAAHLAPSLKAAKKLLKKDTKGATKPDWLVLPDMVSVEGFPRAPRLSVCLIARNEEKFLGRCLASIKGLADQIIVVDTGSTDHTAEIAREQGAEVHTLTWCDDFSAARNAALEHATGDWVLVLDADEELPAASRDKLRAHLRDAAVMAWRLPIVDAGREDAGHSYVPRLFRNAPGVFFAGRVHEHAFGVIEQLRKAWGLDNRLGEAVIVHHGYTKAVTEDRDKVARNLRLLELALQESPNNVSLLMSLGLELCRSKRFDEGLLRYFEAFTLLAAQPASAVVPELRETLLTQFASYLFSAKRHSDVVKILTSPLARQVKLTASQCYVLGMAQIEQEAYSDAAEELRQCLARRSEQSLMPALPEIRSSAPRRALALCLWRLKEPASADKEFQQALAEEPQGASVHTEYARFLSDTGRLGDALQLLHKLVSEKPEFASVWICGAQLALTQPDLLDIALDWTSVAIQHHGDNLEIVGQRAEVLMVASQFDAALPLWRKLAEHDSSRAQAAVILCEAALQQPSATTSLSPAVDQEFARWFQRLVDFKAETAIIQLLDQADEVSRVLPTAGGILKEIAREFAATKATPPTG